MGLAPSNGREGVMKTFAGVFSATMVVGLMLAGSVPAALIPDDEARPPRNTAVSPGERSTESDTEGPRVVTGRVVRVNAQEGTIVIQTPIGLIALRGPKEDLRDVTVGDIVEVEMVDGAHPSASPRLDTDEQ
jgi:hypothetical protein